MKRLLSVINVNISKILMIVKGIGLVLVVNGITINV
jgi:hypothetical protein